MAIDYSTLASRLLSNILSHLAEWFPAGKRVGHEFVVGDLDGSEGNSLSININTGRWADFAADEKGGDLISLYAAMHRISQSEAAKQLEGDDTIAARAPKAAPAKQTKQDKFTHVNPVPETAPSSLDTYYRRDAAGIWQPLTPVKTWTYLNADGRVVGLTCRLEWLEDGKTVKDIVPQIYTVDEDGVFKWRWRAMSTPRPMYNLPDLAKRPKHPVMIVEGEKKVEALRTLAPDYIGIAWAGGCAAWKKTDWSPLKGRDVLLWPDADRQVIKTQRQSDDYGLPLGALLPDREQPGIKAMWYLAHELIKICPTVRLIEPRGITVDGWDAADALAEGWDFQRLKAWAKERLIEITEGGLNEQGRSNQRKAVDEGISGSTAAGTATLESQAHQQDDRGNGQRGASGSNRSGAERSAAGAGRGRARVSADAKGSLQDDTKRHAPDVQADRAALARPGARAERSGGHASEHVGGSVDDGNVSRIAVGSNRRSDAATTHGARVPSTRRNNIENSGAPAGTGNAAEKIPASAVGKWDAWGLEKTGNGSPVVNLSNALLCFEHDPALQGIVSFDEFLGRFLTGRPSRDWSDADELAVLLYLQRALGLSKMTHFVSRQAVQSYAHAHKSNCVIDWLDTLEHDGVPRIESCFSKYFGAPDNDYTRAVGRNFWTSIAARAYRPGCQLKHMVILEGEQDAGKSKALEIIGGPYFARQHESATNSKAFAEVLQGQLIVEIDEMDSFSRSEVATVKRIVSNNNDRYRAAYGIHASSHPRTCVMVGTVNGDDWAKDATGGTRFWPITCMGTVDFASLTADRTQLFAEAVARFKSGASWWEMPAETVLEQAARFDADPWLEAISSFISGREHVSVNEILCGKLSYELKDIDRRDQMRVSTSLLHLGWKRGKSERVDGRVLRRWYPRTAPVLKKMFPLDETLNFSAANQALDLECGNLEVDTSELGSYTQDDES